MKKNKYSHTPIKEFERDLKKLKKYRNLNEDIKTFKELVHGLWPKLPPNTIPISNLGQKVTVQIYKTKSFYSKDIGKGKRSGLRVFFAFIEDQSGLILIEIYHHNSKDNEDRKRIYKYFGEK